MVITIPGNKRIVLDAKAPMNAYIKAFETEDERQQQPLFRCHAEALSAHAKELASRISSVAGSFDFTVMFVPHDAILDAAERAKNGVWDQTWRQHRVLIATPGLLIALLRTIAIGNRPRWRKTPNRSPTPQANCTTASAFTVNTWACRQGAAPRGRVLQ